MMTGGEDKISESSGRQRSQRRKNSGKRRKDGGDGGGNGGGDGSEEVNLPTRLFATNRYPPDGRINSYSKPEYMLDIMHALEGTPEFDKLMESPFGSLFQLPIRRCSLSGKLLHNILCRGLVTAKEHELWFVFAGYPFRFSLKEFAIVTGLSCGPFPSVDTIKEMQTAPEGQNRYWDTLIGSKHATSVQEIVNWLKRDQRKPADKKMPGWRRLRLALVVIVEGIICCGSQPVRASIEVVEMVRNLETFMAYPWGRESFELTIRMIKVGSKVENVEKLLDKLLQSHTLCHGFPLAIQLAIFNSIPLLTEIIPDGCEESFAESEKVQLPKLKSFHNKNILQTEYDTKVEVGMILQTDSLLDEEAKLWPTDVTDPGIELVLRLIREGHQFKMEEWQGGYDGCALMTPSRFKGKKGRKRMVVRDENDDDEDDILYQVEVINYAHRMEMENWFKSQRSALKEELKGEILREMLKQGTCFREGISPDISPSMCGEDHDQCPIPVDRTDEDDAAEIGGQESGVREYVTVDKNNDLEGNDVLHHQCPIPVDRTDEDDAVDNGGQESGVIETMNVDINDALEGNDVVHDNAEVEKNEAPAELVDASHKVSAVLLSLNESGILNDIPEESASDEEHEDPEGDVSSDESGEGCEGDLERGGQEGGNEGEEEDGEEEEAEEEQTDGSIGASEEGKLMDKKMDDVIPEETPRTRGQILTLSPKAGEKRPITSLRPIETESSFASRPKRCRVVPSRFRSPMPPKVNNIEETIVYNPLGSVDGQIKKKFLSILSASRNKEFIIDGHAVKKTFFKGIHTPQNWVDTSQMEAMLSLVWRQVGDSFLDGRIAVLDTWFTQTLASEYRVFKKKNNGLFPWNSLLKNSVRGVVPSRAAKMMWYRDVDYVYAPMNWGKGHWVALAIDLKVGNIQILDPLIVANSVKKMKSTMTPFVEMLPQLVKDILSPEGLDVTFPKTFTYERLESVYQNERTGDCGPVAVKFIELDAQGIELDGLTDDMVDEIRMKYAVDIFEEFVQSIIV